MALSASERKAISRARAKASAALAAHDAKTGWQYEGEWTAPDDKNEVAPVSVKERMRLYRERKKALVGKMPKLLAALGKEPESCLSNHVQPSDDAHYDFDSVFCDWLTISHPLREHHPVVNDGQVFKLNADGTTEWTTECWKTLKCASSDTSLRIKCDGHTLHMTGNIGRFGHADNLQGFTVAKCLDLWKKLIAEYFPKITDFFGEDFELVNRLTGEVQQVGTRITRCDLTSNFHTDNFSALTAICLTRKLGQRRPMMGKYGVMWGYDSKRGNWFKAKLYDKTCELEGRRTPSAGATVARFEVQLGSEILKRLGLNKIVGWLKKLGEDDMENITYLGYSKQVFQHQATAETWADIPTRIRHYAVLWRDGADLRNLCATESTYFRILKRLKGFGLDCSMPCNITTLTRRIEVVKIQPLPSRRAA